MNISVKKVALPMAVKGCTVLSCGNTYTIIINDNLSDEEQKAAYQHEYNHIKNDDFNSSEDIRTIEGR